MMKKIVFRTGSLFMLLNLSSVAFAVDAPLPRIMRNLDPVVFEDPPPPAPQPPSHSQAVIFKNIKFPGAVEDPPPTDK